MLCPSGLPPNKDVTEGVNGGAEVLPQTGGQEQTENMSKTSIYSVRKRVVFTSEKCSE